MRGNGPTLRAVIDESPALSRDELQEHGNRLLTEARQAAMDAVRESMHSQWFERGRSLTPAELRLWRRDIRAAITAWQKADAIVSELLNEFEKTVRSSTHRSGRI